MLTFYVISDFVFNMNTTSILTEGTVNANILSVTLASLPFNLQVLK